MITLNTVEQKINQERKEIIRQVENRPSGYMGTRLAIDERGRIVTEAVIHNNRKG